MSSRKRRREVRAIRDRIPTMNGDEMVAKGLLTMGFDLVIGWDGDDTYRRIGGLTAPMHSNPWWKLEKDSLKEDSN